MSFRPNRVAARKTRQATREEGQGSGTDQEKRAKHSAEKQAEGIPELNIDPDVLPLLKHSKGTFRKHMQPRFVDFPSVASYFPTLPELFEKQEWMDFMSEEDIFCPSAVYEFFNNMAEGPDRTLYTSVKDTDGFVIPSLSGDSDLGKAYAPEIAEPKPPPKPIKEEKIYLGPHGAPPFQAKQQDHNPSGYKQRFKNKPKEADRKFAGIGRENKVDTLRGGLVGGRVTSSNMAKGSPREWLDPHCREFSV